MPESPVFKDKPADYKVLLAVIAEKRREAQLNFTVSVIPEAVEVVERSKLPTAPVLSKMFPDLGDGFAVDTWLASLSKITKKAVNDIKNTTAIKMQERLSVSSAVRAIASKFDYSKYAPPPPATEAPAENAQGSDDDADGASENTQEEQPSENAPDETGGDDADQARRRKRLTITSTTQVPPRVAVVHVVPERYGYGVVALNATETLLNDSLVCHTCTPAGLKRRKFLYFTTLFEDAWADVTTDEFKVKKLELEKAVDDLFFEKMTAAEPKIALSKGYMGCVVLSLFKSTSSSLGAGKRRKRGFREDGLGAEVEVSFRSPSSDSLKDQDIEVILFKITVHSLILN